MYPDKKHAYDNQVFYSIIIPTHNRSYILKNNLDNLTNLQYDRKLYEIIVVDDGSTDDTKNIVSLSPSVIYKYTENQKAPQARNAGVELARGEILIFIDDDCFVAPDYLIQQDEFWRSQNNAKLGILGGSIQGVSNAFFGKICDYLDCYSIDEGAVTKACASNLSIRKELFLACGGFNPILTGAEDVDLSLRVAKRNYHVYYSSKVKVFHHHVKNTFQSLIKRAWNWALHGEAHLTLKYSDELNPFNGFFGKIYNKYIRKIKRKNNALLLIIYPPIGLAHCLVATYRLHMDNRKYFGFKAQYMPFTFLVYLTYELAFFHYIFLHRRRNLWYLRNKLSKNIFSPLSLLFSVTSMCNFECDHCFYYKELNRGKDLLPHEFLKIIKKFKKIDELGLTGGEPFIREDLDKILEFFYLNSHFCEINIPTNGWYKEKIIRLTEKLLDELPLCKINIFLSLHGLEKTHDAITHVEGSFSRALETGKELRKRFGYHPRFYLSSLVCIHSKNINDIEALMEYMQTELPGMHMNLFPVRGKLNSTNVKHLDLAQRQKLFIFNKSLGKRNTTGKYFKHTYHKLLQYELEKGYEYNIKNKKQFIPCFAATTVSKLEETGIWRPCEILEERFDLNTDFLDKIQLEETINHIRQQNCSCAHDCFFKPALEAHPYYKTKNFVKAVILYIKYHLTRA